MSHGAAAPHEEARCARTRRYYREALGVDAEIKRALEIAALPIAEWKGRQLRTIRCCGTSGKGPHDCNVPESMLWALIGLKPFYCVYHRDDAMAVSGNQAAMEPAVATHRSKAQDSSSQPATRSHWELDPVTAERLQHEFDQRVMEAFAEVGVFAGPVTATRSVSKVLRDILAELTPLPKEGK